MNKAKITVLLATRWAVVLVTALIVLSATAFANVPFSSGKPCNESCAVRCPCCISKTAPSNSPSPLAPGSPRLSIDKTFQLVPLWALVLTPSRECTANLPSFALDFSSRSEAPLYARHCAYLI